MEIVILVVGCAVALVSFACLIVPAKLIELIDRLVVSTPLRVASGLIRIIIGSCFVLGAERTGLPMVVAALGWLAILAGLILLVAGDEVMQRIVEWFRAWVSVTFVRVGAVVGLALGGLVVWATLPA